MGFLQSAAKAIGTAYDYATPGVGSSRLTDYGTAKPAAPTPPAPKPTSTYKPLDTSALDKQIADQRAQLAAMSAQLAAQPRLPYYNTSAGWAQANSAAQGVVDPVYTDKLNAYLEKEAVKSRQQTEAATQQKTDIQTALQNALQDIATNRGRNTEDRDTSIGDVATNETGYQTNEGRAFDQARTALLGGVSDAGLTTSGIGQQQVNDQITDRNVASNQQTQQFEAQRRDIQTKATRTFEDLDISEGRSQQAATGQTKATDKALADYIENAALDEKEFRVGNEADRLIALNQESSKQYQVGVANFIASLVGSGARSQDIALASQVYR